LNWRVQRIGRSGMRSKQSGIGRVFAHVAALVAFLKICSGTCTRMPMPMPARALQSQQKSESQATRLKWVHGKPDDVKAFGVI